MDINFKRSRKTNVIVNIFLKLFSITEIGMIFFTLLFYYSIIFNVIT